MHRLTPMSTEQLNGQIVEHTIHFSEETNYINFYTGVLNCCDKENVTVVLLAPISIPGVCSNSGATKGTS